MEGPFHYVQSGPNGESESLGPFEFEELAALWRSETVNGETYALWPGIGSWTLISSNPDLIKQLAAWVPPSSDSAPAPSAQPAAPEVPAGDDSGGPFYFVDADGAAQGPKSLDELRELWQARSIDGETYVLYQGDQEWRKIETIDKLVQQLLEQSSPTAAAPESAPNEIAVVPAASEAAPSPAPPESAGPTSPASPATQDLVVQKDEPLGQLTPLTAEEPTNCAVCDAGFSFLKRVHHCRFCGMSVCDDCSSGA